MSTRSADFVTLNQLLEEVGVDAARFFYLTKKSDQALEFDIDLAISQDKNNPVYYIQYAYARICSLEKELKKNSIKLKDKVKIIFVKDRPGHDIRYALNSNKIRNKLGWSPRTNFEQGIKLTFDWYNKNKAYYKSLSKKDIVKRLGKV